MRRVIYSMGYMMAILASGHCHAEDPGFTLGGILPATAKATVAVYHVFSGTPVNLAVTMSGTGAGNWQLVATISQKGGALAAPVEKDVVVAKGAGPAGGVERSAVAELSFPDIKRITEFLVDLRLRTSGGGAGGVAQRAVFKVYPRKLIDDGLIEAAAARRIHLFGPDKTLRQFFQARHMTFEDSGDMAPETITAGDLYIGTAGTEDMRDWLGRLMDGRATVVVFKSDPDLPAGIFTQVSGASRLSKVTLPILTDLETNPLSEETLLALIQNP